MRPDLSVLLTISGPWPFSKSLGHDLLPAEAEWLSLEIGHWELVSLAIMCVAIDYS